MIGWTLLLLLVGACASEVAGPPSGSEGATRGVTQGGPQDIGAFRRIVGDGHVPDSDVLDPVGFFAEHALDLPPADCGETICVEPSLAVAPRFDGGTWTMGFVTLTSAVEPGAREPGHVVFVVDVGALRQPALEPALAAAFQTLDAEDRISLIAAASTPSVIAEAIAGGSRHDEFGEALDRASASPDGDTYLAMNEASRIAIDSELRARIVLITGGMTRGPISSPERFEAQGAALASEGIGISVIGVGDEFDEEVAGRLGTLGTGTYAVAVDGSELRGILSAEAETSYLPLATDFELTFHPSSDYRIGRVYGGRQVAQTDAEVTWRAPALFLGHREGASDTSRGRRGGGSGFFVELLVRDDARDLRPGTEAFRVSARYREPEGGRLVELAQPVVNGLVPGQKPEENWPTFVGLDKPFMMLNMYLALSASIRLYEVGECAASLGVTPMMTPTILEWQRRFTDPDIDADDMLLRDLQDNIATVCRSRDENVDPVPPVDTALGCFLL